MEKIKQPEFLGDRMRLDAIAEHLRLTSRFGDPEFTSDVRAACLKKVNTVLKNAKPSDGEEVVHALADSHSVQFEEVRDDDDIRHLEGKYLREKRELGFGQLRMELAEPGVDALLFKRLNAKEHESDKWVAVLNLQDSSSRAHWSRSHELIHRIAEPPQQILPLRRHRNEALNPVERLIDTVAADVAFYPPLFGKLVQSMAQSHPLTFDAVKSIMDQYAPSASLLSVANATVKHWPTPAMMLVGAYRGRKGRPNIDKALRVEIQARNNLARSTGLIVHKNMRPPFSSPLSASFVDQRPRTEYENLHNWSTSRGDVLPTRGVLTCALPMGQVIYGLLSEEV